MTLGDTRHSGPAAGTHTERLIAALAADLKPVERLAPPGTRLVRWLLLALPLSLILGALVERAGFGEAIPSAAAAVDLTVARLTEPYALAEMAAILATAIAAGYAAFASIQPGRPRVLEALPLPPFLLWLVFVGEGCWRLWQQGALSFAPHWICFPSVAATGSVPALVMILMLRKGALVHPAPTVALAALAASALGAVGLRLFHPPDATWLMLLWQFVATVTFFAVSGAIAAIVAGRPSPRAA